MRKRILFFNFQLLRVAACSTGLTLAQGQDVPKAQAPAAAAPAQPQRVSSRRRPHGPDGRSSPTGGAFAETIATPAPAPPLPATG